MFQAGFSPGDEKGMDLKNGMGSGRTIRDRGAYGTRLRLSLLGPGEGDAQGRQGGAGAVRCAPVVVAPVGARGHGSPRVAPALSLMVYTTMALARWCGGPGRRRGIPVAENPSVPEFLSQIC